METGESVILRVYNKKGAPLDFVIRQARPDEAPKVIALITLQHGKNYPDHTVYDRDFMRDHIEKDLYRIILAEHADGTAMGVVGFKKENPFPGSLVFSFLVVDPRFRGFGLGKLLLRSLLDFLSGEAYTCVWGYCITIDTLSQASHDELGYRPAGLVPNCYFFDANGKFGAYLDVPLPLKHSLLVMCLPCGKRDAGVLYAPSLYREYITEVYESMQVMYRLREPEIDTPEAGHSLFAADQNEYHHYCELMVQQAGIDFKEILEKTLAQYAGLENQTFNTFISLNDPGACFASRVLEEQGFFFTGLQPLAGQYEYMLFHYSPGLLIPFDTIKVTPAFERRLAYIKNLYYLRNSIYTEGSCGRAH
jgi:GNAT superfamily N-acetyltransferase